MFQHLLLSAKGNWEDKDSLEYIRKTSCRSGGQKLVLANWYDLGRWKTNYCNKTQLLTGNLEEKPLRSHFHIHFPLFLCNFLDTQRG